MMEIDNELVEKTMGALGKDLRRQTRERDGYIANGDNGLILDGVYSLRELASAALSAVAAEIAKREEGRSLTAPPDQTKGFKPASMAASARP